MDLSPDMITKRISINNVGTALCKSGKNHTRGKKPGNSKPPGVKNDHSLRETMSKLAFVNPRINSVMFGSHCLEASLAR